MAEVVIKTVDDWDAACVRWQFDRVGKVPTKYGTIYVNEKYCPGKAILGVDDAAFEKFPHYRMMWAVEARARNGRGLMDMAQHLVVSAQLDKPKRAKFAVAAAKAFLSRSAKAGRYAN